MKTKNVVRTVVSRPSLSDILRLRLSGMTCTAIAQKYGITQQAVSKRLKGVFRLIDPEKLQAYREQKSQIFTALEAAILDQLSQPERLKKASMLDFGIIYDKNRLEQGKPTTINQIFTITDEEKERLLQLGERLVDLMENSQTIDVTPTTDVTEEK